MPILLSEVIKKIEQHLPLSYQEAWDKSGLQLGSKKQTIKKVLFTLDFCHEVIREAIRLKADLIVAHHPLSLSDFKNIDLDTYEGWMIQKAIEKNIALYAAHTSHDNQSLSLSYYYAKQLGLNRIEPLSSGRVKPFLKLVVYVPIDHTQKVMTALFEAGAGHVGAYSECSFRTAGMGTFKGDESTHPFIGQKGIREEATENRLEVLVERFKIAAIIEALIKAHPYEEVAYDLVPLENKHGFVGTGAYGALPQKKTLRALIPQIKKIFKLKKIVIVGNPDQLIESIGFCNGSGAWLINYAVQKGVDLFMTGDIKYHAAIEAKRQNLALIDLGHFASEVYSATLLKNLFDNWFGKQLNLVVYDKLKNPFELA